MVLLLACQPLALEGPVPQREDSPLLDTSTEQVGGTQAGVCSLDLRCPGEVPDEPKVDCELRVEDADGFVVYDGQAGVETRGRSSSGFPKQQFAVELREGDLDVEVDLLGMGAESDWVLNGAWIDRALLRNKVGYDLFQSWGGPERYAPESRNCLLTLNGQDHGIYFLVERITRDSSRIDVPAEGSMVVKLDDAEAFFPNSVGYGHWNLVHPSSPTPDEAQALTGWFQGWEAAVLSGDGLFDYVDRDSAIDFLLLQEFMKNNDAYFLSVHLWRGPDGPAFFTPWDLDLSFGQPTYNDNVSSQGWLLYRPAWVLAMAQSEGFQEDMEARWLDLRQGELSDQAVLARVDAQVTVLQDHVEDNFAIWPWDEIDFLGGYLPPVEDYDQELENIRQWIPERLRWMDQNVGRY